MDACRETTKDAWTIQQKREIDTRTQREAHTHLYTVLYTRIVHGKQWVLLIIQCAHVDLSMRPQRQNSFIR